MGISRGVKRSTFAEANENRDYRIYEDFALFLIRQAVALYKDTDATGLKIDAPIYAIDATVIDLCVSVFWWAPFRKTKAAIKLNTQLDLKCGIPTFINITDGKEHDVNSLDCITFEQDAFYVMDKGYIDYTRLYTIHKTLAFFVTRAKRNFSFRRIYSAKVDKSTGIICDQTIKLTGYYAAKNYPDKLRRIKYYDKELNRTFVFITNNFKISAQSIAALYKNRWKIELFFKWIKQHLKVKTFWGQSKNAVYTQIWVAISNYVLIAILQKRLNIDRSRYEILQILSVSLFDKTPINQLLATDDLQKEEIEVDNQLKIF
jgi:transposase